jgi:hypothetical protein
MTYKINLRLLALCVVTAFALLGFSLLGPASMAREPQEKLRAGERFEVGGGQSVEIRQCRDVGRDQECEVQYYRGNEPEGKPMWQWAGPLLAAQARVAAYKQAQAGPAALDEKATDNAAKKTNDDDDVTSEDKTATTAECTSNVPSGESSSTAKPSAELFKRRIYYIYNVLANGTGSAPLKVGVTFLSFEVSKPFTNVVRVDPVGGAHRINDAAPVNAIIYPVRSKHIVCEQYRDGLKRRQVENKYNCFKNRDGEWVCGADGIPKISQLN